MRLLARLAGPVTLASLLAPSLYAQDLRSVAEPRFPEACAVLSARHSAPGGKLSEASEAAPDTARIQAAIDGCAPGQAVKLTRAGEKNVFLTGPLQLRPRITLWIDAGTAVFGSRDARDYDVEPGSCGIVTEPAARGRGCKPLILAEDAPGSGVMGEGAIDGRGGAVLLGQDVTWWDLAKRAKVFDLQQSCPRLLVVRRSNDFTLYRITLRNSPNFHVVAERTDGFTAWGVKIRTPKTARNSDGIDPSSSNNVTITHCHIDTGDDNVAIKASDSGPATHMTIAHNHFYAGHGMSIGSGTSGGVSAIRVSDLTIDGADNGLRIKSDRSRGGLVEDVAYESVCMRNVANPIVLTTMYTNFGGEKPPVYRNIVLKDVHSVTPGSSTLLGLDAARPLEVRLDNVFLDGLRPGDVRAGHARLRIGPRRGNLVPSGEGVSFDDTGATAGAPLRCEDRFEPFPDLAMAPAAAVNVPPEDPTLYVAADGTGDYYSIQRAIDVAAEGGVISVAPGVYRERLTITKRGLRIRSPYTDPRRTVVVFDQSNSTAGGTLKSATVQVRADDFQAENMTFANDWNATHPQLAQGSQAVALLVTGDRGVFRNVRIVGNQDTLYAGNRDCDGPNGQPCTPARQYFEDCYVEGNVDFIFGDGNAFFERCEIRSTPHPEGFVTAQGKHYPEQRSLFVFNRCRLTAEPGVVGVWLGRPWRDQASVVFLDTEMGAHIEPAGFREWHPGETSRLETAFFGEWGSSGEGAHMDRRDRHVRQLTADEAKQFAARLFLAGADSWDPASLGRRTRASAHGGAVRLTPSRGRSRPRARRFPVAGFPPIGLGVRSAPFSWRTGIVMTKTRLFRTLSAILSLTALAARMSEGGDQAVCSVAALPRAIFDCGGADQRFTCAAPADPDKRFVCHGTGSASKPYVKISTSAHSSHTPGIAHGNGTRADQSPGASGNDVGSGPGLDCDCNERLCIGVCTGSVAGATCDDGNRCTGDGACLGDQCQLGAPSCTAGTPVDACNAQNGACDAGTGECSTDPTPAGTVCGADQVCNAGGSCVLRVVINEIESSGGVPGDWVELFNAGAAPADVSGWTLLDNDDAHTPYVIPAATIIDAGGHLVLEEARFGFGLGSADSARLYDASGALVDSYRWTSHAVTTYGRCPNGAGAFATTVTVTKGAANDCLPVRINEIESSGGVPGDWVELFNAGATAVDLSGWVFKDNDNTHSYSIPSGTTMPPGTYFLLEEAAFGFGLGSADSSRLFDAQGAPIDSYTWTSHASTTYGRCPNGTGAFTTTASVTKGAANACSAGPPPAQPWPGTNTVVTVDAPGVFGGNLSGLFYEPAAGPSSNVLWAVRNGPSTLFRLVWNGSVWTPEAASGWDTGKTLRYTSGTGSPDSEDVTKAELFSSALYVATERDNDAGGVSRLSVLRFDADQPGSELTATHEWNLNADLPVVGANLGLEGITWIPDSFLVARSFFDERSGHPYVPAEYANHGTGLFFIGLEATGVIYAYALDHVGGGFSRVATIASGNATVKGTYFDREVGYLWAECGAACDNQLGVLRIDTSVASPTFGRFKLLRQFARPSTMPNLANEGLAIAPESECMSGFKGFFWADDSETGGHALRFDSIPCGLFIP